MLIAGETGTGKELIAQACHAASDRADKPFMTLNCASLPDDAAEKIATVGDATKFIEETQG